MPKLRTKLVTLAKPRNSVLIVAFVVSFTPSAAPARAQNIFDFFRALSQPPAPTPAYQPFEYRSPAPERRRPKARPKPAPVEQTETKKPMEPRTPGEMDNPVPALLADSTLRSGDLVMFPDGLRVFTGRAGGQHSIADFKPLAQAGKHLSRATRKLIAHLLPSENPAWSMDGVKSGNRLAANTEDVGTKANVKRTSSRDDSRLR